MPSKAEKILARMRDSQAGWTRTDLDKVYRGFGFEIENRAKHDVAIHPDYPQFNYTLPRHRRVKTQYVRATIKIIDKLRVLQNTEVADK